MIFEQSYFTELHRNHSAMFCIHKKLRLNEIVTRNFDDGKIQFIFTITCIRGPCRHLNNFAYIATCIVKNTCRPVTFPRCATITTNIADLVEYVEKKMMKPSISIQTNAEALTTARPDDKSLISLFNLFYFSRPKPKSFLRLTLIFSFLLANEECETGDTFSQKSNATRSVSCSCCDPFFP